LFLRESVSRLSAGRGAAVWLLADPVIQTVIMLILFTVIRMKVVGGIDVLAWLIIGLTFFNAFKRTASQVQNAISANRTLFAYRQVKPIDTLLVRACLEGFLTILVVLIVSAGAIIFFNVDLIPGDPLMVMLAFLGLWLMGLGFGLITSAAVELIPELGKIISMIMTPLYMTSGAILPLNSIPEPYRGWLMFNPLAHGLEISRWGVSPYYHVVTGANLTYLYQCALVAIFLGLALQARFATKFLTQ
jgi:capsular polysaccharide transport system permease protein